MYIVLIITFCCAGHRLWERRNDWTRSWECRKRKMYKKNRTLGNQKRSICFNGPGMDHQNRPCYTGLWYTCIKMKQVRNFVHELTLYIHVHHLLRKKNNFWFYECGCTFSVHKITCVCMYMKTICCSESISLFSLMAP